LVLCCLANRTSKLNVRVIGGVTVGLACCVNNAVGSVERCGH
jgi:hypothetical protein